MSTIYLNSKDVPSYLRGGYTGKQFRVNVSVRGFIPAMHGIWDGGSRETYSYIELSTGRSIPLNDNSAPWSNTRADQGFDMISGFALVCHSHFCGRDAGLTFTIHPDDATKMLPASSEELSPFEAIVLKATKSYKSSYNGQDRYDMARPTYPSKQLTKDDVSRMLAKNAEILAQHGDVTRKDGKLISERIAELEAITEFYPTRDEWETAKASLIARKLLNKAGAITNEGRNAVSL